MINIPRNEAKIKNHFFLLIFSFRINALANIPKGIASWDPRIIGEIIEEWYKDKFINTYTNTPIETEKIKRGLKNFLLGIRNFQKGIKIIKTKNILNDAIKIGGTELFKANFATGNELPWAIIMKMRINKCLTGNFFD